MGPRPQRRQVIGQDEDGRRQGARHERRQDLVVDALDRLDLLRQAAHVRRLVGRLDVDPHEVVVTERLGGGARLGAVVGVEIAGRARHVDHVEAGDAADAAHQIDGADDRAALSPYRSAEARHARRPALAPEPRHGRRADAGEDLVGAALKLGEPPGRGRGGLTGLLAGQVTGDGLVEDVVRRRARDELAAAPDQEPAVGHAGVELEAVAVEPLAERREAAMRLVVADVAGGVVLHDAPGHRDEVTAVRDVVRAEVHDVHRLEWAAAAVHGGGVVAEHREVAHVAARRHARRHCADKSDRAAARERVHRRRVGGRQGRTSAELQRAARRPCRRARAARASRLAPAPRSRLRRPPDRPQLTPPSTSIGESSRAVYRGRYRSVS